MSHRVMAFLLSALVLAPVGASAETLDVVVDARSKPWNPGLNPKLAFGVGDGLPPKLVRSSKMIPGVTITLVATGQTTTISGARANGPEGLDAQAIKEALMPINYTGGSGVGMRLNALMGAFVTADGTVIGRPFLIGRECKALVPDGAAALSLGVNDDRFSDNGGEYKVQVTIAEARVTVEPS